MKIGLVRRGYSATGGAENYLCRLADALEAAGHEPMLFASPDWPRDRWPAHRDLVMVNAGGPRAFADGLARLSEERYDRLFSLERVWRCDCYRAGDGVHAAWLERRASSEPAWRVRLRAWNPKHRQLLALENALFGQGGARTIIANSQMVRGEILDRYGGTPDRVQVVYNGLPAAAFQPPAAPGARERTRAAWQVAEEDYAILFAGSGWERKGLVHALAAVARLPGTPRPRLIVAGRGNPRPFLKPLPPHAVKRIQFLGPVADMRSCYAAADVFVAPTLYDPFSNACLEALATGLPVLTTPANGFSEILTPGRDGEVLDPADPDALPGALAAWADPARRDAARSGAAAKAAAFTIEANVTRTLRVLLDL